MSKEFLIRMRIFISVILIGTIIYSCFSSGDNSWDDRKYTSYVFRLPSDDGTKALYSYYIKYPGAHYGQTRFIILPDTAKFSPSDTFFAFSDTLYGYNIEGWSGDTIKTLCITASQDPPQELLPYKREVEKVHYVYWLKDYYKANAFGGNNDRYFDSISYSKDILSFIGKDTSFGKAESFYISAKKTEVRVPLGDTIILVDRLENYSNLGGNKNPIDTRKGTFLTLQGYLLRPKRNIDWKKLKDFGIFVEQVYKQ